jgi:hypothetical protein
VNISANAPLVPCRDRFRDIDKLIETPIHQCSVHRIENHAAVFLRVTASSPYSVDAWTSRLLTDGKVKFEPAHLARSSFQSRQNPIEIEIELKTVSLCSLPAPIEYLVRTKLQVICIPRPILGNQPRVAASISLVLFAAFLAPRPLSIELARRLERLAPSATNALATGGH